MSMSSSLRSTKSTVPSAPVRIEVLAIDKRVFKVRWECPHCTGEVGHADNYCRHCGKSFRAARS
jgi:predicted amidophosphoribosyltransferase